MSLLQYKCPKCGGALKYDSQAENVKCPYCDTEFPATTFEELDKELNEKACDDVSLDSETEEFYEESDGLITYVCNSCGAQIVTEATTSATNCPYCNNPVVMMGNLKGDLKPELIVPFKMDRNAAIESLKQHMKGKKFLPKTFSDPSHLQEVKGVYVPFWLYDSKVDASVKYSAQRSFTHTEKDKEITETQYFSLFRAGNMSFTNIPVDGSRELDNSLSESVEPYDLSKAVPFQTSYMAGFYADRYDVSKEECHDRAQERMRNSAAREFEKTIVGFSNITVDDAHINIKSGHAKYGLLPIWILTTKWNDETYTFAMNGQTGKFVGNLPCDKSVKTKTFFKTFAFTFLIAAAVQILAAVIL